MKNSLYIIILTIAFLSTVVIIISLNIDYDSISSYHEVENPSLRKLEINKINFNSNPSNDTNPTNVHNSYSNFKTDENEFNPIKILDQLKNYITTSQSLHNSGDTIKRSLIAQVNNALLILKDEDSDNDKIICDNFVNKFISKLKLYERIGVFNSMNSNQMLENILTIKNLACNGN